METLQDLCIANMPQYCLELINVLKLRNYFPGITYFVFLIQRATDRQRIRTGPIRTVLYILGEINATVLPSSCLDLHPYHAKGLKLAGWGSSNCYMFPNQSTR